MKTLMKSLSIRHRHMNNLTQDEYHSIKRIIRSSEYVTQVDYFPEKGSCRYLLAEVANEIVGCASFSKKRKYATIHDVTVMPEFRRRSIFTQFLDLLFYRIQDRPIICHVPEDLLWMQVFLRDCYDFKHIGSCLVNYVEDYDKQIEFYIMKSDNGF